jgi:hypothetical protein
VKDIGKEFFVVSLSPVLQPLLPSASLEHATQQGKHLNHVKVAKGNLKQEPWSIDWMDNQKTISEGGVVFSSSRKSNCGKNRSTKTTRCTSMHLLRRHQMESVVLFCSMLVS